MKALTADEKALLLKMVTEVSGQLGEETEACTRSLLAQGLLYFDGEDSGHLYVLVNWERARLALRVDDAARRLA